MQKSNQKANSFEGFNLGGAARRTILIIAGVYFLIPLAASIRFALQGNGGSVSLESFQQAFTDPNLWPALLTSLEVGAGVVAITLALLVPTAIWVNLRLPQLRRFMEGITLLPLVIPAVVLVLGIYKAFASFPNAIVGTPVILALEYVILGMPYCYRAIDAGVQAIDLHTLVDAGRSLGSSWPQLLFKVLLPNLKGALLGASFLAVAFVLGEFAVANLLTFNTFPTWLYEIGTEEAGEAIALSVLALVLTWAILLGISFAGGRSKKRADPIEDVPGIAVPIDEGVLMAVSQMYSKENDNG